MEESSRKRRRLCNITEGRDGLNKRRKGAGTGGYEKGRKED